MLKYLSTFDKGQIVMTRRLGKSSINTAVLVGCSQCAMVNIYQKWSEERTVVNKGLGRQGSLNQIENEGCPLWSDTMESLCRSNS